MSHRIFNSSANQHLRSYVISLCGGRICGNHLVGGYECFIAVV